MKVPAISKASPTLTRPYAVASLVGVLIAGIALSVLYRELSIRVILRFGEQGNVAVARTTVHALGPELVRYLEARSPPSPEREADPLPPEVLAVISGTIRDTSVARVKIHDRDGIVAYSSRPYEVGSDDSDNLRFKAAMQGEVRSELSYRDAFSLLGRGGHDDNLIETYVPIIPAGHYRPVGVLEIYTDVHPVIAAMNRNEVLVVLGVGLIMAILYGLLVYVVRRSEDIITKQRQIILERNRTLEILSARMLAAEDNERRRISTELHEEIAQTLSAVKLHVESYAHAMSRSEASHGIDPDREIVPLFQEAIREVRALAMDLRPPSLDDFGLLTTVRTLCREAPGRQRAPGADDEPGGRRRRDPRAAQGDHLPHPPGDAEARCPNLDLGTDPGPAGTRRPRSARARARRRAPDGHGRLLSRCRANGGGRRGDDRRRLGAGGALRRLPQCIQDRAGRLPVPGRLGSLDLGPWHPTREPMDRGVPRPPPPASHCPRRASRWSD